MQRFELRLDPLWKAPLLLVGASSSRTWLEVSEQGLSYRFGWLKGDLSWNEVAHANERTWSLLYGIGVRITPDCLGFVGSTQGCVEIALREPHTFKVPFSLKKQKVVFSLNDPAGFLRAAHGYIKDHEA